MSWLSRLLGKSDAAGEELVVVPIPPLITLLQHQEAEKGLPLTEQEVFAIRNAAVCMTMKRSRAEQLAASRGFADINPARVWEEWVSVRSRNPN